MYQELDPHGDAWSARIRRDHERHAGVPDFGYCPGRDATRPWPPMVSAADIDHQRFVLGHCAAARVVREQYNAPEYAKSEMGHAHWFRGPLGACDCGAGR